MNADRWAYLAVRAYTRGLLSFSSKDRVDPRWSLKEELLLDEVERDIREKLHTLVHLAEVSAAQYVDQKVFDHHHKAANQQYNELIKLVYPYSKAHDIDKTVQEFLVDVWKKEFGDPESEAVQNTIEFLKGTKHG